MHHEDLPKPLQGRGCACVNFLGILEGLGNLDILDALGMLGGQRIMNYTLKREKGQHQRCPLFL